MYTYTVRPMYRYYRETLPGGEGSMGLSTLSRAPEGFKTIIRVGDRVVHQFPRMEKQDVCHTLAQKHIANLNAEKAVAVVIQKMMS